MPRKLPFRVIHASGQDESYRASELNYHSPLTKGWQASRYCLYPQDIVLQLDQRCRLRKIQILSHQYLIATKIEFFVGDVPEDMSPNLENARYTRLGYVSLSDNEKTGFKARELKSVHVDAVGLYLKLNIHKNHINKYNIYNQVGIIAINVIGETLKGPSDFMDPEYYLDPDRKGQLDDLGLDTYNKPDYISPLDDLAFDMYQDPEIAGIIRKLEKKKQEAVLQERFDYAKRLKSAITELQKVGEKLGKYEVEKRQAVENEDYDKAKLKKVQMDEYRLQVYRDLNLADLLETTGSRHPQVIDLEPIRQATPPRLLELTPRSPIQRSPPRTPPPRTPYDERPLPALKSKETPRELPSTPPQRTSYDERPLPVKPPAVPDEEPEPAETAGGITGEPEPLTEKDLREASAAIDVFGEQLVSKAYSKTWSYREDALLAVYKQMQDLPATAPKDEAKSMLRASIFLVKKAIDDKVYAVFKAGLHLLKMILTEYVPKHKIPKQDTVWAVERSMQNLLHKSGDTAVRNRDDAKNFVLEMARYPEVKPTNCVPHEAVKPMKNTVAPRLGQSRCEIVEMLYKDLGIKTNSGLNIDNMMQFCVAALGHHAGEVRDVSERIIKALYKEERQAVKDYLPADDDKTRKITLYRQLFEYFDKVDGKPSKADVRKQRSDEETKKQAEIEALQKQLQSLKDMASGKQPVDENLLKADKNKKKNEPPKKSKIINKKPAADDDDTSVYNMDNICIFCGERNESFTEEGLDLHYWKHCPMLKRCTNCKQVVEIATYTDHLLNECEAKNDYSKCNRCTEAIPKSEYDQHVSEKSCNAAKSSSNHCPLCHQNVSSGEDGWKNHLMGKDGCKQNPRRLLSLNKNPPTGGTSKNKPKATGKNKKTPR
ncbi:centrosomal protein of 104 kDa-like isoform X5 [Mytilus californianus]|uniref:centrosomal protein of 104 kDa-like isoform X5 n=1 Tax=Mytilus californianus TaxID=6549 RepID=UPI0022479456|nr:centrosomal protein of 104 kDa-like isoform X5 [Mytilus californianus]